MKDTLTVLVRRDGKDFAEVKGVSNIKSVDGKFTLTLAEEVGGYPDILNKTFPSDCEIIISGTDDDAVNLVIAKNDPQD